MNQFKRFSVAAVGLALGLSLPLAHAAGKSRDALQAQAKVAETDARATALANVTGGTVQSGELEKERGKLVWSFDIKDPNSRNVVEVQVDAKTGAIVSKKAETPTEQAQEKKADATAKR